MSADQDKNNNLNMAEFIDLIFSSNDALNVDLKQIENVQQKEDLFLKDMTDA